jgi:hypothetical protein
MGDERGNDFSTWALIRDCFYGSISRVAPNDQSWWERLQAEINDGPWLGIPTVINADFDMAFGERANSRQ